MRLKNIIFIFSSMAQKGIIFFKNLDALRFLAFLGVYIQHTLPLPEEPAQSATFLDLIRSVFSFCYLGVPFFFTLSSFLITYRILEEYKKENRMHLIKFYLKRGLRIWPVYFLLLLICFLIIPLIYSLIKTEVPTLPSIWPFLLFWSNFYMISHGVGFIFALIPLWSISIEEQFYFFWGMVLKFFKKYIYIIIALSFIISVAFCYYYLYNMHQTRTNIKLHSLYAVTDFCTGALIATVCQDKQRIFRFLKWLPSPFYTCIYVLLIVFYLLQNYQLIHVDLVITTIINSVCYALILFDQTFNDNRMFNTGFSKSLNYLGKISYGLYIYHELIVSLMVKLFHFLPTQSSINILLLQSLITLAITILTAHLSYRYFERYFLSLKDKL